MKRLERDTQFLGSCSQAGCNGLAALNKEVHWADERCCGNVSRGECATPAGKGAWGNRCTENTELHQDMQDSLIVRL